MALKSWESLPAESRFWCFSAAQPWSEEQNALVHTHLTALCEDWAAHGTPVEAGFTTVDQRLIALAVDERAHAASGCSIDSRMKALTALSDALGIDLFGRMHVYVGSSPSGAWEVHTLGAARKKEGYFLNTVATCKGDWQPICPISGSWLRPATRG